MLVVRFVLGNYNCENIRCKRAQVDADFLGAESLANSKQLPQVFYIANYMYMYTNISRLCLSIARAECYQGTAILL